MRQTLIPVVAIVAGLAWSAAATAQSAPPRDRYFAPARPIAQTTAGTSSQQTATGLPGAAAAPRQVAPESTSAQRPATARRNSHLGSVYTTTVPVQLVQNRSSQGSAAGSSSAVTQAPTSTYSPAPAAPVYGGPVMQPLQTGISSIYAYGGRAPGPYCANAIQYYSYGGSYGWGSPYNSIYYDAGCYRDNACCRASRRISTPFGGATRGCEPGCYVITPPPCSTACYGAPYTVLTPRESPTPYAPPAAGPQPKPMPPKPEPVDTPEPPQPEVKPDPQVLNSPRVPIFPRGPALPKS